MCYAAAQLLDRDDPGKFLKHAPEPIMVPQTDYERDGFVRDVVFPTGLVDRGGWFRVYDGAADTVTAVVE